MYNYKLNNLKNEKQPQLLEMRSNSIFNLRNSISRFNYSIKNYLQQLKGYR
jgi:hypothetical protein